MNHRFELVDGQQQAVGKMHKFLRSSERIFRLTGKAGTGKTTVIAYALEDYLKPDYEILNEGRRNIPLAVLGCTIAHKAKERLRDSIPYVNTFASTFGYKEKRNTEEGTRDFLPDKWAMATADCTKSWRVVVIDEVSMLSESQLKIVFDNLDPKIKIIVMGDRGQLPPILSSSIRDSGKDSPIFDYNLPDFCSHHLDERIRQKQGNPIIDLSDFIYDETFGACDIFRIIKRLKEFNCSENGVGYSPIAPNDLYDCFANSSGNNFLDTKMLAYRRITVRDWNKYLRDYIHYNPVDQYIPNEIIYMDSTYFVDVDMMKFMVHNSSEHVIQNVEEGELEGISVDYVDVGLQFPLPAIKGGRGGQAWRDYKERIKELERIKAINEKFSFMDLFARFNYGYALTAYKAQGSTYKNVFVDANDIFQVTKILPKRKLQALYTSITRASNRVYFTTDSYE